MNTTASRRSLLLAGLLVAAGCRETGEPKGDLPAAPKQDEIYQKELLSPPAEDVRQDVRTAKDIGGLEVKTLKEGEGKEELKYWASGSFHIVLNLASGKDIKNTHKLSTPEELSLVEGAAIDGMVFGCIGMKKGEVRLLTIPAEHGYGEAGDIAMGVPANATLIARVELVEIGAAPDPEFLIRRAKAGEGRAARSGEFVRMHYTGILADGDKAGLQFDSSRSPGRDEKGFQVQIGPMGGVIDGWKLGLLGIKKGEKRWLKIPPHLAYGAGGSGKIPPNATLIFEVEMLDFDKTPPGAGGQFPGGQFPGGQFPGGLELGGQGR